MKIKPQILVGCLFLILLPTLLAQDNSATKKPSRERIKLHLEYHFQRAKLLKSRMELLKTSQGVEESQVKLEVKGLALKREMVESEIRQAQAQRELNKNNVARLTKLHERNVVPELEVQNARQELSQAEAKIRNLTVESERLKQESASAELSLKRRQLEGAIQMNGVELELLEAEFRVKELKLELDAD